MFIDQLQRAFGVVDRRFDLAAVADDAGVSQQALHVAAREARDRLRIKIFEGAAEVVALAEDREPAETGLKSFQANFCEQPAIVRHRTTPFLIVIAEVKVVGPRPRTPLHFLRAAGGCDRLASASSAALVFLNSARVFTSTSGNRGSSDWMASTTMAETTMRVNHLRSAGTTNHGAHSVPVWRIMSS